MNKKLETLLNSKTAGFLAFIAGVSYLIYTILNTFF